MGNLLGRCGCRDLTICNLSSLRYAQDRIYRRDYRIPNFLIERADLDINIQDGVTMVSSVIIMRRNPNSSFRGDLTLDGDCLKLVSVKLNGAILEKSLHKGYFQPDGPDGKLVISSSLLPNKDQQFTIETIVEICPETNTKNMGLYYSAGVYSTQCESDGFRRITFFLDRPDVMCKFKVRIEADKTKSPVLLSNGNLLESGDVQGSDNRHYAIYVDPFPKPSYLFAVVAGVLDKLEDKFITRSGKSVRLFVYSDPKFVDRLRLAMESLKLAMKWDEDRFGLEYDLEIFNIVAVESFNFGAMENKSLNIFNCSCLLASENITPDALFTNILSIVGHEYFHNYTGNRVTCRDWFQLTLKEGLTVYRDQEFSRECVDRLSEQLGDIEVLRNSQFQEDSGPLAHPIRPDSIVSTNNLYTSTVYRKGAEVVRMYETILGRDGFRKGMDLYFARHDGQAVTCDDFRRAMGDANNYDFTQFERWYDQAGTPEVEVVSVSHNKADGTCSITLRQRCSPTPEQPKKRPFYIPVVVGLIGKDSCKEIRQSETLILKEQQQTFVLDGVWETPVASILRGFSAPVNLRFKTPRSDEELAFLFAFDTDEYNRYDAAQTLYKKILIQAATSSSAEISPSSVIDGILSQAILSCFESFISKIKTSKNPNGTVSPMVASYTLKMPSYSQVLTSIAEPNFDMVVESFRAFTVAFASKFRDQFVDLFETLTQDLAALPSQSPFIYGKGVNVEAIAIRRLLNVLLDFIAKVDSDLATKLAHDQYNRFNFMTSKLGAISALQIANCTSNECIEALDSLLQVTTDDVSTLNLYFSIIASCPIPENVERVISIYQSNPQFIKYQNNPTIFSSLVGAFAANFVAFNRKDGLGYSFVADAVISMDKVNPMSAASVSRSFTKVLKLDEERRALLKENVLRILGTPGLSKDTSEILKSIEF
ncbi:zincin/aminopeptidase N like metalloprotease [Cryptosporidium canis]|uniref:Zincin/aminopeptidase N like metalloprotease n=1 Tax=Cryptosporidium canis TaxID=195482 RepID=A0ABQ8P3T6_9CRYT|nr:zincin/aminopeptidase N like metalloprotease [Cryptosporidium canis]KAJ1615190.1 zincin/aminopeptidase N like metalloprotease [Cryptosporidium canis]